jgi:hypothetical protein
MPQLYSKNRIMPDFACHVSAGAKEDVADLHIRFVIPVVAISPLRSFLAR